jgi:hypothetical protein
MTDEGGAMVRPKTKVSKVLMVGPLVPFADDLGSMLVAAGYAPLSIVNQLRLLAHVSRWMDGHDYAVTDLTGEVLKEYLAAAHAAGRVSLCSQGGLTHLLRSLPMPPANPERVRRLGPVLRRRTAVLPAVLLRRKSDTGGLGPGGLGGHRPSTVDAAQRDQPQGRLRSAAGL